MTVLWQSFALLLVYSHTDGVVEKSRFFDSIAYKLKENKNEKRK
jgi:predicted GNAT superfamily acetyltransferase